MLSYVKSGAKPMRMAKFKILEPIIKNSKNGKIKITI